MCPRLASPRRRPRLAALDPPLRRRDSSRLESPRFEEDAARSRRSQWTYQAMVHELLGLNSNRVKLKGAPGVKDKDLEEVVLSATDDAFYAENKFANFGDLGMAVKDLLDDYQRQTKMNENTVYYSGAAACVSGAGAAAAVRTHPEFWECFPSSSGVRRGPRTSVSRSRAHRRAAVRTWPRRGRAATP